ncbi:MAG: integration host factor subunit alpha [Hydrogenophaga sp.]|nr:integration host factor subunit alpha [Hydrogenophaga sp.]
MNFLLDNLEAASLTKAEIAEKLTDMIGLSNREARDIVDGFFEILSTRLVQGEDVKLAGFGNFSVAEKEARPGRNLHTGEQVEVKARRAIRFKTGPKLRQKMVQPAMPAASVTHTTAREEHQTPDKTILQLKLSY